MKAAGLEATTLGPTAVAQRHQAQAQLAGGQGHRIAADRGCGGAVISRQRASFERHLHGSGSAAWTCDIVGEASAAKQVFELEGLAAVSGDDENICLPYWRGRARTCCIKRTQPRPKGLGVSAATTLLRQKPSEVALIWFCVNAEGQHNIALKDYSLRRVLI